MNTPKLGTGMTPVKWDETNQKFVETTGSDKEWYDYNAQKWANAITTDGSYWVWIPRYSYQIADNYHTNSATGGTINVEFMKGTTNESSTGRTSFQNASGQGNWNIHPAFNYGSEVAGIWVAKYEASQSDAGANAATYQNSTGGTSGIIKIQPSVNSWRNITIGDMYTKCLNYNTTLNSHMMKNMEWGAVAYLTQSKYGRNKQEVGVNECNQYITGMGPSGSNDVYGTAYAYNANYVYNTVQGKKASTTGNAYGVYDMSGGAEEHTAAYIDNGYIISNGTGNSLANGELKTKDIYRIDGDTQQKNYDANSNKYGDAIYEISNSGINQNSSWYSDCSYFPFNAGPWFRYGGPYNGPIGAGIFSFNGGSMGQAHGNFGFRPVCIVM